MAPIKFDLAPITDPEGASAARRQADVSGLWENLPFNQLPDKLSFSSMGGVPVSFRSGIIRVALAKLAITGVLAALVSIRATNADAAFSCAMAAAVNFVACAHYWYILRIRTQDMTHGFSVFASARNSKGEWVGRTESENDEAKMFEQETQVESLRFSDWTVRSIHTPTRTRQQARVSATRLWTLTILPSTLTILYPLGFALGRRFPLLGLLTQP